MFNSIVENKRHKCYFCLYLNIKIYSNLNFQEILSLCTITKNLSLLTFIEFQHHFSILFRGSHSQLLNFSHDEVVSLWSFNVTDIIWFLHNHTVGSRMIRTWWSGRADFRIWKMFFCSRNETVSGWRGAQQKARWFITWLWLALSGCFIKIVKEAWILQSPEIFIIQ